MQNLYDLTMDPPKEHAIPIQITTRRKDGRHITSTTNTFAVAEAARTKSKQCSGDQQEGSGQTKAEQEICGPSSSRSKLMSSPHRRKRSVSPSHPRPPGIAIAAGALPGADAAPSEGWSGDEASNPATATAECPAVRQARRYAPTVVLGTCEQIKIQNATCIIGHLSVNAEGEKEIER